MAPEKKRASAAEQFVYNLGYTDAAHKHAATSATSINGGPTFTMTYDANGNMTTENSDTFTYNGDNQLVKRTISGGATITYTYDGQGNLVKKSSSDGTWTVYIGGIYEKHSDGSWIDYYSGFGRRIAMRTHTGPSDPGTVRYLLADTLGSTSTVLSSTATVLESEKYYPYGGLRSGGVTLTDKKFTGQQDEGTAFGLYDYGARFYSTVTGRFVSADPVAPKLGNPQTFDRYAYANDNPLRYVDPTGLDDVDWQALHRLADALNQQRFIAWGQDLISRGVPAGQVGNAMKLISQFSRGAAGIGLISKPVAYVGKVNSFYDVDWSAWEESLMLDSGGTLQRVSFELSVTACLPKDDSGIVGVGTGSVFVYINDPGRKISLADSQLQVVLSNLPADQPLDATFSRYVYLPSTNQVCAQYDFHYFPEWGYPTEVRFSPAGTSEQWGDSTHLLVLPLFCGIGIRRWTAWQSHYREAGPVLGPAQLGSVVECRRSVDLTESEGRQNV